MLHLKLMVAPALRLRPPACDFITVTIYHFFISNEMMWSYYHYLYITTPVKVSNSDNSESFILHIHSWWPKKKKKKKNSGAKNHELQWLLISLQPKDCTEFGGQMMDPKNVYLRSKNTEKLNNPVNVLLRLRYKAPTATAWDLQLIWYHMQTHFRVQHIISYN